MSRFALSMLPLCLALGAGCSSQSATLVDYHVTGGFTGRGDGGALTLDTSGFGTRTTPSGAPENIQLDATTLADLNAKIQGAQFATLQPTYGCNGCNDGFVYEIAVQSSGRHYAVSFDESSPYPEGLRELVVTIKQIIAP